MSEWFRGPAVRWARSSRLPSLPTGLWSLALYHTQSSQFLHFDLGITASPLSCFTQLSLISLISLNEYWTTRDGGVQKARPQFGNSRSESPPFAMKLSALLSGLALVSPAFAIFQLGCGETCNGVIDAFDLACSPDTKQHHGTCKSESF
jgi:hypothetical protein